MFFIALFLFMISGCAAVSKPVNQPIEQAVLVKNQGYTSFSPLRKDKGDFQVMLVFSGGGTRAAAMSYGVMQELRDTPVGVDGGSLLDEVDYISAVSGGSFTAAYYGIHGDKIFTDYEEDFLRTDTQSSLIWRLFSPSHWFKSIFTGYDRTEMAVNYYDKVVFDGATYADINIRDLPFIEISASDLSAGTRFSFTQDNFDLICSDLNAFPVARAVTASSAVPILFPSVVLKNHASECDVTDTATGRILALDQYDNERQQHMIENKRSYREEELKPYIHLVDGGVTDNLGLRAIFDNIEIFGEEALLKDVLPHVPDTMLVILVNASVTADAAMDQSAKKPKTSATLKAITNIGIDQYSFETKQLIKSEFKDIEKAFSDGGRKANIYLVDLSFNSIETPSLKRYLNSLPTALELSDEEIDAIIYSGKKLLKKSPVFSDFVETYGTE